MGGRAKTIPSDVKVRIDDDSPWRRYPQIFGGVGVASLLLAFVVSTVTGGGQGDHGHEAAPAAVEHQESAPGGGHGQPAHDEHGSAAGHGTEDEAAGGHASEGHGGADAEHGDGGHHGGGFRFWYSYLTAYMFGLSIGLGGLFFVVLQFLVRAGWSVVVRRIAENIMFTLPLFAVLFIPVALGLSDTHSHWWDVEVGIDPLLDGKRPYLNKSFFFLRAIAYLIAWTAMSRYFYSWSQKQDETGDNEITHRLQGASALAVVLFGFSVSFAAIDWLKSMDPHWYSTMWGVYFFAGCLIAIFSTLTMAILTLQRQGYIHKVINEEHYHDLGKLLFGFNVFWSYIAFSQYFLIWYANIPEEQLWFDHRSHGGWREFGIFLAVGHFFIPFFYLLPRATKRNTTTLFIGAAWMLFIHYVDIYFIVMPQFSPTVSPSIVDLLALVGVVSLFLAVFSYATVRGNLLPIKDPRLGESLAFENI